MMIITGSNNDLEAANRDRMMVNRDPRGGTSGSGGTFEKAGPSR
jgi:hypothetical protein